MHLKEKICILKLLNLQSDNANCYQNGTVVFAMILFCKTHITALHTYIHIETPDGKGAIDDQFAIAMGKIYVFVNRGHNVGSPKELYDALIANSGALETSIIIFTLDREKINRWNKQNKEKFAFFSFTNRVTEDTVNKRSNMTQLQLSQYSDIYDTICDKMFKGNDGYNWTQ